MAQVCEICGKRPGIGHTVSHAHNLSIRRFKPNLRVVHVRINGRPRRIKACTRCIKAGKITK